MDQLLGKLVYVLPSSSSSTDTGQLRKSEEHQQQVFQIEKILDEEQEKMADIEQNENSNQAANTMEETDLVTPVEARLATLDKETVSTNDNVKNDKQELLEDKEDKQGGTHSSPVENDTDTQKEASAIKTSQTKEEKKSKKDISKVSQSEPTKDKVKPTGLAKKKSNASFRIIKVEDENPRMDDQDDRDPSKEDPNSPTVISKENSEPGTSLDDSLGTKDDVQNVSTPLLPSSNVTGKETAEDGTAGLENVNDFVQPETDIQGDNKERAGKLQRRNSKKLSKSTDRSSDSLAKNGSESTGEKKFNLSEGDAKIASVRLVIFLI